MNDKEIRAILIEFIKTKYSKVRIFQEKSIGKSICDIMAVSDCITGFEIKSDLDNFNRLPEQIRAYNLFFDKNYIVVSDKHINKINDFIPREWGIIYITANNVVVNREAKTSKCVSRYKQLSILWKIELKNLLVKNQMPSYALKSKDYIASKISKNVDKEILGKQIADELLNRDYSIYDAEDYSILNDDDNNSDAAVINQNINLIDTLSEKDFSSFTLDKWIAIYNDARKVQTKKNKILKKKTIQREKFKITYKDIKVALGAPWIDKDIINDFVKYISGLNRDIVFYESITGSWYIEHKSYNGYNYRCTVMFGTERYNALQIIEASLNLREIKIIDNKKVNQIETIAALEKKEQIDKEFENWIFQDEDRIYLVEKEYNKMFDGFTQKSFDGSKLKFPKMNSNFKLFDYQKDAVQRIINERNTLLAFDVGSGKTFIMIAAAMKMRQEGISNKNMFVVPNNIVGQWEKIFSSLYPKAKILTIEPKTFKPKMRQKVLAQIKTGSYDGIIIAYSCFEMIPISHDFILKNAQEKINVINDYLKSLNFKTSEEFYKDKMLKKQQQIIKKMTDNFIDSFNYKTNDITFDELEINTLFLDEAHNYKNIPLKTRLKNLNGINTKGSKKCLDMLHKIRLVQSQNDGSGAVFATGTPLCNSISDAYAMQLYLQNDVLEKNKLNIFDNWIKTFAKPIQKCEVDVDTSKFRFIDRFDTFYNLPELSLMFSQIAFFHSMDNSKGIPNNVQYKNEIAPKNKALSSYMLELCERTEKIRSHEVDKHFDNMLKVSTDGRKAALDLTLVGRKQKYNNTSKIYNCVKNVINIYNKYKSSTQLIFCDYSTPKTEKFDVYSKIKEMLISNGINKNHIAFIHSYQSEARKVALFKKVNDGEIRILLGSTLKLGIGANVQEKLKAIHHLDVPWRPADMVQREGRILRRGNTNNNVFIFRYIAKGSFDSYAWQVLERKQQFISDFLKGSTYQRSSQDLDNNALTYAEVKAIALAQPLMKTLAEKDNEINRYKIANMSENKNRLKMKENAEKVVLEIAETERKRTETVALKQQISELKTSKESIKKQLKPYIDNLTKENFEKIDYSNFKVSCFNISVKKDDVKEDKFYFILSSGDTSYKIECGETASGNALRISNFILKFEKQIIKLDELLEKLKAKEKQYLVDSPEKSEYDLKLKELQKERDEIFDMIQQSNFIAERSEKLI